MSESHTEPFFGHVAEIAQMINQRGRILPYIQHNTKNVTVFSLLPRPSAIMYFLQMVLADSLYFRPEIRRVTRNIYPLPNRLASKICESGGTSPNDNTTPSGKRNFPIVGPGGLRKFIKQHASPSILERLHRINRGLSKIRILLANRVLDQLVVYIVPRKTEERDFSKSHITSFYRCLDQTIHSPAEDNLAPPHYNDEGNMKTALIIGDSPTDCPFQPSKCHA